MPHKQSDFVEVRLTKKKGRGVFARRRIPLGTEFERVPVVLVTWDQIEESELQYYVYTWHRNKVAMALGYGSLYNHSYAPNARYVDVGRLTKAFVALRDIAPGEEITVNYNADPHDRSDVGFSVDD